MRGPPTFDNIVYYQYFYTLPMVSHFSFCYYFSNYEVSLEAMGTEAICSF